PRPYGPSRNWLDSPHTGTGSMQFKRPRGAVLALTLCGLGAACMPESPTAGSESVTQAPFGVTPDGQQVSLFTISNANGMEARVINLGGIIVSLTAPDREGNLEDVVLGFDSLDGYLAEHPYFGAIIGRY